MQPEMKSKRADFPPAFFRESQGTDKPGCYEKGNNGGCFNESVIEPARNSLAVEESQDSRQQALDRFFHDARAG